MKKILLIEDDKKFRVLFSRLLERKFGILIREADNGETGLKLFCELKPDILFLDIELPGLNGIELLKEIRKHNKYSRVVMITNNSDKEYVASAVQVGVDDYIIKTDFILSLQERLEKILGRGIN
ncbi:MAG: response regulator [bacterium]